ncbi:MAG: PIG-L family deacetylase [Anaerolineae bacterium]|nr:PIG-L family deacetylase [Anaerolineae bacterium]GIK38937.1 MAG: GlcNAc-PI de-N-acetylase [Chloroflexota bacterium]
MNSLLAQAERIMVIMAHPDDIEIQCGGTVAGLVQTGKRVTYVLCTSGNHGTAEAGLTADELAAKRETEQQAAASVLGVGSVIFLRHNDGDLAYEQPVLRREVVGLLRQYQPQVVFTHDPFAGVGSYEVCYLHPDHRTVGEVVLAAAFFCAPGPLFYADQFATGLTPHRVSALCLAMSHQPDLFVDIGQTFEAKVRAIACHTSQWGQQPDTSARLSTGLAGFFQQMAAGIGRQRGIALAEAFKVLKA